MRKYASCYNCFDTKHKTADCPNPIQSFGIICYHESKKDNKKRFLMVKRQHSFCFIDFISGNYDIHKLDFIQLLFDKMTVSEKASILTESFADLWNKAWKSPYGNSSFQCARYARKFSMAAQKFSHFKIGFYVSSKDKWCNLHYFVKNSATSFQSPEWYFPKGKRLYCNETNMQCAIREFVEETNIHKSAMCVQKFLGSTQEQHYAINNKSYAVTFFIAKYELDNLHETEINLGTNYEIGEIQWLTALECLNKFRSYEQEKYLLLQNVCEMLNKDDLEVDDVVVDKQLSKMDDRTFLDVHKQSISRACSMKPSHLHCIEISEKA